MGFCGQCHVERGLTGWYSDNCTQSTRRAVSNVSPPSVKNTRALSLPTTHNTLSKAVTKISPRDSCIPGELPEVRVTSLAGAAADDVDEEDN